MSDSGILSESVKIKGRGRLSGMLGEVVAIYATRKGPSYRIKIYHGELRPETLTFKREEFELCKLWTVVQIGEP